MSFRTNRRTLKPFPVIRRKGRTLGEIFDDLQLKGRYQDQITWLKEHGFGNFDERTTPDGYILETWVDNFGNAVRLKVERISGTPMADATIVASSYDPAPLPSICAGCGAEGTINPLVRGPRGHNLAASCSKCGRIY